jgi:3',5'-cyclic AMP phosphodiesterase CpdA
VKIVHISDLHFGEHNEDLAADLLSRVPKIKPDLILCTGDVVDNTDTKLYDTAVEYLQKLTKICAGNAGVEPPLIVVPGNHDYFKGGVFWKDGKDRFGQHFGGDQLDRYFPEHGVWVFGFDSASEGSVGGGGQIRDEDLSRFHDRYRALEKEPGFREAFKIIAVHHHPLPVNWDKDWKQRWLTMSNAGPFLSAALSRRVDLVLHGHEHLQARAHLKSTLGGDKDDFEVTVISLGATLRKMTNPERNWFSVIKIESPSVTVDFFQSAGLVFDPNPTTHVIRSIQQQSSDMLRAAREERGYSMARLVAYSVLSADGDAKRMVECENLERNGDADPLEKGLAVKIPFTSGYLDKLRIIKSKLTLPGLSEKQQPKEFDTLLTREGASDGVSFAYAWYAVNAFAMDTAQFPLQYAPEAVKGSENTEFTYFPVHDPVEELTLVVQFPDDFQPEELEPRVSVVAAGSPRQWKPALYLENDLRATKALRFYEAMSVASLRVPNPRIGASYGIQWKVPAAPKRSGKPTPTERRIQEMRKRWIKNPPTRAESEAMLVLLARLAKAARVDLMDNWDDKIEASFLFFDPVSRSLAVLGAAIVGDKSEEVVYGDFRLPYGMGIAGRAFKANRTRIYAPADTQDSDEPDYYYGTSSNASNAVLACIPVQNPEAPEYGPYGVFCMGSGRADCPLADLGEEGAHGSESETQLEKFQLSLNRQIIQELVDIYLKVK